MTYEFKCNKCEHIEEVFKQLIQKNPMDVCPKVCPNCGEENTMHQTFSAPSVGSVLFNCKGFYATDVLGKGSTRMEERKNKAIDPSKVSVDGEKKVTTPPKVHSSKWGKSGISPLSHE